MRDIKVDFINNEIIMTRKFAAQASDPRSAEYALLQATRQAYPNFAVRKHTIKKNSNKECYKGLTYDYMEKYIKAHDDESKSIMNEYKMLRGITDEAKDALADSCSYQEIKAWFLAKFPAIAKFHEMRQNLLAAAN